MLKFVRFHIFTVCFRRSLMFRKFHNFETLRLFFLHFLTYQLHHRNHGSLWWMFWSVLVGIKTFRARRRELGWQRTFYTYFLAGNFCILCKEARAVHFKKTRTANVRFKKRRLWMIRFYGTWPKIPIGLLRTERENTLTNLSHSANHIQIRQAPSCKMLF